MTNCVVQIYYRDEQAPRVVVRLMLDHEGDRAKDGRRPLQDGGIARGEETAVVELVRALAEEENV